MLPQPGSRIEALLRDLEASPTLDAESLVAALAAPIEFSDIVPWVRFDAETYRRNFVARTDRWEVRLMCWRPGQATSLHPHGASACAFRIIRGSATETRLGDRDRVWTQGEVVREPDGSVVHQVANREVDALISLHVYSPPLPVDAPSPAHGHEIVVVGGGFAGAAAVTHLLARGDRHLRITWVEHGPWLGRGIAYGVESPVHKLNVPASRMSIDPSKPNDFVDFAGVHETPSVFCPRSTYGRYVTQRIREMVARSPGKLRVIRGTAINASADDVHLADGTTLEAKAVVLATGLAPRIDATAKHRVPNIVDAWDEALLAGLPASGHLLVLGAGLTALDVLAFLAARNFDGRVTVVSRRGLLPLPHLDPLKPAPALSADDRAAIPTTLAPLVRWVRRHMARQSAAGVPWQLALDMLRPHVPSIWRALSPRDRQRFVRRVRPYWDIARHRASVPSLALVERLKNDGRLRVLAGSIQSLEPSGDGVDVILRTRDGEVIAERYDGLVRCIGPAIEGSDLESPLVKAMIASGVARRDPAGLGIHTDSGGRIIDAEGHPNARLVVLGALQRAEAWETTAVPEIAVMAQRLAEMLLGATERTERTER